MRTTEIRSRATTHQQPVLITEVSVTVQFKGRPTEIDTASDRTTAMHNLLTAAPHAKYPNDARTERRIKSLMYYQLRGDPGFDSALIDAGTATVRDMWQTFCDDISRVTCPSVVGHSAPKPDFIADP